MWNRSRTMIGRGCAVLLVLATFGCAGEIAGLRGLGGDGKARLVWDGAANADGYAVLRSDTSGGPYKAVATGLQTGEYADESLTNGRRYYYVISASDGKVTSSEVSVATCAPPEKGREWDDTITTLVKDSKGKDQEAYWSLWIPKTARKLRGIIAISQHGAGNQFSRCPELRCLAGDLDCAVVALRGAVQRGVPDSKMLLDILKQFAEQSGHPELAVAPMILFGHSNGTGFSAGFAAAEPDRIISWIAFKSANGRQFSRPEIYGIPGLVISGETDKGYFTNQLTTVEQLRRENSALMHMIVEPKAGHEDNSTKTFSIILAFMKETFLLSVPADADLSAGPAKLIRPKEKDGWLGQNWDRSVGGYQLLPIGPYSRFKGNKRQASWLPSESYARKWQEFIQTGSVKYWW